MIFYGVTRVFITCAKYSHTLRQVYITQFQISMTSFVNKILNFENLFRMKRQQLQNRMTLASRQTTLEQLFLSAPCESIGIDLTYTN